MKTLKKNAVALLAMAVCSIPAAAQLTDAQSAAVEKFFRERLENGGPLTCAEPMPLKKPQVADARARVWALWKEANKAWTAEEKLIPLQTLDSTRVGKWTIPAELEPDAVMNYYYGKKTTPSAAAAPMPFFLYLHGSGPRDYEWATGLTLARRFSDAPSVYFIPQIPNEGKYYRWWQKSKQFAWERLLRQALLSPDIDPNKMYVFGISEGGYGSQRLASFYADYWAGAGPMAGGEPLRNAPVENCSNIGFSFLTGADDQGFYRNILTRATQAYFDSMSTVRPELFNHRIELIPSRGHHIDYSPTTPWLRRQTRNPFPRHFYWEDMDMDGRYRDGFYNIYVERRANKDAATRMFFKVDIEENVVRVDVSEVEYEITERDPNWGIEMAFRKHYKAPGNCRFRVYLGEELVDMDKKVTVVVNGKTVFRGKPRLDARNIVSSCAAFFDPCRLFPAAVEVEL